MNVLAWQLGSRAFVRAEHPCRAARVKMRTRRGRGDDLVEIEPSAGWLVIESEAYTRWITGGQTLELVQKSRVFLCSARVVKLPGRAERDKPLKHGPDGRDADPTGDQHRVRRTLDERKVVAWWRDLDRGAHAELV